MKIGVALGSGSARGWAHIGVLRALAGSASSPTSSVAPRLAPLSVPPMPTAT